MNRGTSASLDLDGDARPDTLGRERGHRSAVVLPGQRGRGAVSRRVVGSGWQMHDSLVLSPDLTGDARPDLWARDLATGGLWVYPGDGAGSSHRRHAGGLGLAHARRAHGRG